MPSWITLVVLVGAVVTLYMLIVGIGALWTRKMQLINGGRMLCGPLAQWCGLVLLAVLPLSLVTCGLVAYQVGVGADPEPARSKVMEFLTSSSEPIDDGEKAKRRQEINTAFKELAKAWIGDFTIFGMALAAVVWAVVDLAGVRPARRRAKSSQP